MPSTCSKQMSFSCLFITTLSKVNQHMRLTVSCYQYHHLQTSICKPLQLKTALSLWQWFSVLLEAPLAFAEHLELTQMHPKLVSFLCTSNF